MAIMLLLALPMAVGVVTAGTESEATPVALSWVQYAIYEGESRPHAYMQYRLVKVEGSTTTVCAEQEADTGVNAFDAPGMEEVPVPAPPPWDLDSIPCHGEVEEQTRLVWRTLGEPPLYGVPLPTQQDRGDGWIAHRIINVPDVPTAVEIVSFTVNHQGRTAIVEWETASELDLVGFNLIRDGAQVNDELIPSKMPGAPQGTQYTSVDADPGTVYWLEVVEAEGNTTLHGPAAVRYGLYIPMIFQNTLQP
jgi:hypothetical protein